jgi:hypothetical protein
MGMVGAKHQHMQMNIKKMMVHSLWPNYVVGILALFELVYLLNSRTTLQIMDDATYTWG